MTPQKKQDENFKTVSIKSAGSNQNFYKSPLDNLPDSPDSFGLTNKGRTSWNKKIESSKPFLGLVMEVSKEMEVDPGLLATFLLIENSYLSFWLSKNPVTSYDAGVDMFYKERSRIKKHWEGQYNLIEIVKDQKGNILQDLHLNDSNQSPREVVTIVFKTGKDAARATALFIKLIEKDIQNITEWNKMSILEKMAAIRFVYNAGIGSYKKYFDTSKLYIKLAKDEEHPTEAEKKKIRDTKTTYNTGLRLAATTGAQAIYISQKYFSVGETNYSFNDLFSDAFSTELKSSITKISENFKK